jgi:beta-N-acetylhexosaminidase
MIGQMLMIGFPGGSRQGDWPERIARMIHDGRIGGVILFSENVVDARQVKALIASLKQRADGVPPFIGIDQEGGIIQRLTPAKGFVGLPSAQRIAAMNKDAAFRLYCKSAQELAGLGLNVNFGPVVDLNLNPANPAIGRLERSYGREPDKVVTYATQFIEAHRRSGVLATAKHFPGHGSAQTDPHAHTTDITRTWQETELSPFRALIDANSVDMIMVGHLIHPRFSDEDRPASLSKRALQDVLRKELGFGGLIVTDDLEMAAVRGRYGVEEAAVIAIAAGADQVMVVNTRDPDPRIADRLIGAVAEAVTSGRLPRQTIEQSYKRIMALKKRLAGQAAMPGVE